MNQFAEQYKSASNTELLRIVQNASDYQPEAVEAARNEINGRQLTEEELSVAKQEFHIEKEHQIQSEERRERLKSNIYNLSQKLLDSINPIQKTAPTSERIIRFITIVFGLIAIYRIYNQYGILRYMLFDDASMWSIGMVGSFIPMFLLPIAVVFFGLRLKVGWILMSAYLTYSAISAFGLIIMTFSLQSTGVSVFDRFLPRTSPFTYLLLTVLYGGVLYAISKKNLREYFKINQKVIWITIGVVSVLTIAWIAQFLLP